MKRSAEPQNILGLSLGGGKTDKTCLVALQYFPEQKKVFLTEIFDKIRSHLDGSSDDQLFQLIVDRTESLLGVGIDVPLTLPKCMRCRLKCPGYKDCSEPEISWMRTFYAKRNQLRKPRKEMAPYIERCAELYFGTSLDEPFQVNHPLGSNMAPLYARAHFLRRRLEVPLFEVFVPGNLWRIGRGLKVNKADLRKSQRAFDGEPARKAFVEKMIDRDLVFVYRQDQKILIQNLQAFNALICALSLLFKFLGQAEKKPIGFPRGEAWPVLLRDDFLSIDSNHF